MPSNKGITWGHKSEPYQHLSVLNFRIVESAAYFKSRDAFVEDSLSFFWLDLKGWEYGSDLRAVGRLKSVEP